MHKTNKARQYLFSFSFVCTVSVLCYLFSSRIDYKIVAFLLLVTVSVIAVLFDIWPVLASAAASALIWNFFFIPPRFTLHVGTTEDTILFVMYFVIAMINAVLTYKIRQAEERARQTKEKAATVKLYNTLLNSLSHELRTPIAAIIGATDNLQAAGRHLTDTHKDELLSEISKAAFRLNQQVENLLNMSRLESGFVQPKRDWCDINEIVYNAVKRVEENSNAQRISISINPAIPLFKLDKDMLEQIVYNLVNNAALYTPAESKIDITATCHADVLELVVEDDGPGFPPTEIKKAFDKFYRLKNTAPGGTGLGLSIVKGFTEALGGTVKLENVPIGGARFTIRLPAGTAYPKTIDTAYIKPVRHD